MSFLSVDGVQLHYQVLAPVNPRPGVMLVFLHGLVMDNLSSWFFTVANQAAQEARVLLYDLRGHGMSDRPRQGYGLAQHLTDLQKLLDHVAPDDQVILIGNSFGGLLALNFARYFPERTAGLVLIDAQINDQVWRDDMMNSLRLEGEARQEKIAANFQNWLGRHSERKSNRLARNAYELVHETTLLDDLYASPYTHDTDLEKITAPVLAVYGGNSDIIGNAECLARHLPSCRIQIFAGCTHSVLWEQTETLRDVILATVQEQMQQLHPRLEPDQTQQLHPQLAADQTQQLHPQLAADQTHHLHPQLAPEPLNGNVERQVF
ncbi:alpha/beta fold hydrolase [Oligoflexus tunisiensis]|uniref:alpha/beta fold hydrolase n=1 Tax=Oligoflexus tunisiensis TaxID=708132 RepID=UPI000B1A8764|nr:alpha/beta hydrolase [Oligoflexus tunisiensis]